MDPNEPRESKQNQNEQNEAVQQDPSPDEQSLESSDSTEPSVPTQEESPSSSGGRVFGLSNKQLYMGAGGVLVVGLLIIGIVSLFFAPSNVSEEGNWSAQEYSINEPSSAANESSVFDRYNEQSEMEASIESSDAPAPEPISISASDPIGEAGGAQTTSKVNTEDRPEARSFVGGPELSDPPFNPDRMITMLDEIRDRHDERFDRLLIEVKKLRSSVSSGGSRVHQVEKRIRSLENRIQKDNQDIRSRLATIQQDRSYLGEQLDALSQSLQHVRERQITEDQHLKQWQLLAIGSNRAVLRGPSGSTHSVQSGEQIGSMTILSIQPDKQLVRTSQGTILRR